MFVYVLNQHGEPLMPCQPRKARLLLREKKAKVVKMVPFAIQLLYGSSGYKQEVSLGIDAGTQHIGASATTEKTVLFEAQVQQRTDMQELLSTRKQFRHARSSGYFDLRFLDGTKIHTTASAKRLKLIQRASSCLIERRSSIPPISSDVGVLPENS